jgi:hypothetical protein
VSNPIFETAPSVSGPEVDALNSNRICFSWTAY